MYWICIEIKVELINEYYRSVVLRLVLGLSEELVRAKYVQGKHKQADIVTFCRFFTEQLKFFFFYTISLKHKKI